MAPPIKNSTVPVIAASMVKLFSDRMRLYGKDPGPLLGRVGLAIDSLEDDAFIPAQTWYDFAEAAAEDVSDRHFGYRIGSETPVEELPNFGIVQLPAATLGEVLTALIIDAERILTLATYELSIRGKTVRIESTRTFKPTRPPAQIDGFFMGFLLKLFRLCVPQPWSPSDLVISVCDPNAFPPEAFHEFKILKGKVTGTFLQFPTQWLLARTDRRYAQSGIGKELLDRRFIARLRDILRARLSEPDLSVATVARLTSCSVSGLQARLSANGTTYTDELKILRSEHAKDLIASNSISIAEVGKAVGYPDPTAFSRAFKSWTGITPREFRRNMEPK